MGNMWRCCIFSSRHPNRIQPTNSRILEPNDRSVDSDSDSSAAGKCLAVVRDPNICPLDVYQEDNVDEIFREAERTTEKLDNEAEVRKKGRVFDNGDMTKWTTSIVIRNALLPSYMTFDNRRHLSMRWKYTEVIQKMNHSTTITESKEEEDGKSVQQKNNLSFMKSMTSNEPQKLDALFSQFSISGTTGKPVVQSSYRSSQKIVEVVSPRNSVTEAKRQEVNVTLTSPATSGARRWSAGDASTKAENFPKTDCRRKSPEFPAKSFRISSNWLDEDFEESILSDPRSPTTEPVQTFCGRSQRTHAGSSHEPELQIEDASDESSTTNSVKIPNEEDTIEFLFSPVATNRGAQQSRRLSKMFKKNNRASTSYSTKDSV